MALIQLGVIVTNIKGSIGGTTFSMNRAGLTAKKRLVGKRLANANQLASLNDSMAVTVAWNSLSFSQKTDFNNYALANAYTDRFGVTKQLTGFQWYKQLSQSSMFFAGSQLTAPPPYSIPPALPTFALFVEDDGIRIVWSTPIDTSLVYVYCYTTKPTRGQARTQRGLYKLTDIRSLDYSSSFNITDAWNNAHGMDYASLTEAAQFNINVMMFAIDRTSLNNGIAQFTTAPLIL
jgi:hypothetical protein